MLIDTGDDGQGAYSDLRTRQRAGSNKSLSSEYVESVVSSL